MESGNWKEKKCMNYSNNYDYEPKASLIMSTNKKIIDNNQK